MRDALKLFGIVWFGLKNNRVIAGFMLLLCGVILPAFSVVFGEANPNSDILGTYGCIAACFGGFFIPITIFSYLYNKQEYDFYSSMPVKKSQYFLGYFISGFLIFLIPASIMFLIHSAMGTYGWNDYFWQSVAAFSVIYCSTVFCTVFSGSRTSTAVSIFLINCLAISLVAFPLMITNVDVNAYIELLFEKISIFTPVTAVMGIFNERFFWDVIPWQLLIAASETVGAFFLHKYRTNESSTALAFPKSRYFFQYIVMLVFALAIDAVLLLISGRIYSLEFVRWNIDLPIIVFFTALSVLAAFVILNMILERNPRAAFKRIRHLFIFSAGYCFFLFIVINICHLVIPVSVLPFSPESAVIHIYEIKPSSDEDKFYLRIDNVIYEYPTGSNGEPDYNAKPKSTVAEMFFKKDEKETFFVNDRNAIDELVCYSKNPVRNVYALYTDFEDSINKPVCFFPCGESFPIYSEVTNIDYDFEDGFYLFTVDYYDTNAPVSEADINHRTAVRHGFSYKYENIARFKNNQFPDE